MKHVLFTTATAILFFLTTGCKKGTDQSAADAIAGNYSVKDTTYSSGCDGGAAGDVGFESYGIVITKKSDNVVTISSFNRCSGSFDASVTSSSIVALASEPCTSISNVVGTVSGNQIRFNYNFQTICTFNCRGTATKQ